MLIHYVVYYLFCSLPLLSFYVRAHERDEYNGEILLGVHPHCPKVSPTKNLVPSQWITATPKLSRMKNPFQFSLKNWKRGKAFLYLLFFFTHTHTHKCRLPIPSFTHTQSPRQGSLQWRSSRCLLYLTNQRPCKTGINMSTGCSLFCFSAHHWSVYTVHWLQSYKQRP